MNLPQGVLSLALAAALGTVPAAAQQAQTQAQPAPRAHGMAGCPHCAQMMAEMRTMDARLDQKIAAMNAATGPAKVDAMAAVINEMAAQRKQMMSRMMNMQGGTMAQAMPNCPMMGQPAR